MTQNMVRADSTGNRSGMDLGNDWLYDRLRDSARPLFIFEDATIPAASVWTGSRKWVRSFREQGLDSGDRVVLGLPPGPAFVQVLVAALWEDLSLFIRDPKGVDEATLDQLDARTGVLEHSRTGPSEHWYTSRGPDGPISEPLTLRNSRLPASPDVRLWLETSGTTGDPRIIGLSERNVMSVVQSHASILKESDCMLSYLPWSHCFGLVMDLMIAIDRKLRLVRLSPQSMDGDTLRAHLDEYSVDHLNTVPRIVRDLDRSGFEKWDRFEEGVVGGATIDESVADLLSGTKLRVGYGQTEASPGITLGNRGHFEPGILGEPVNCTLSLSDSGELIFEGINAHCATYRPEEKEIQRHPVPRAVATGDLADRRDGTYFFRGRRDHRFKLPNGRFLDPVQVETTLERHLSGVGRVSILPGKRGFHLVLTGEAPADVETVRNTIDECFDGLDQYRIGLHQLPPHELPTNNKGDVDRNALQKILRTKSPSRIG